MKALLRGFDRFVPGGRWSKTLCVLLLAIAGTSLLDRFHSMDLMGALAWNAGDRIDLHRLLTYPFVGGLELGVGLLLLGLMAGDVSTLMGPGRFLTYLSLVTFGTASASLILLPQTPLSGPLGPAVGMSVAFCALFPYRRVYGLIPTFLVSIFGVIGALLVLSLLTPTAGSSLLLPSLVQVIGAGATGLAYFGIRPALQKQRAVRTVVRRALQLLKEDYEKERLDQLLEKISLHGSKQLSRSERKFLRQAARRQREQQTALH